MLTTIISGIILLALVWWFLKKFFWQILFFLFLIIGIPMMFAYIIGDSKEKNKEQSIDRKYEKMKRKYGAEHIVDHTPIGEVFIDVFDALCEYDELLPEANSIVLRTNKASPSLLKRELNIDLSRAEFLLNQMECIGLVGPSDKFNRRKILMTESQYNDYLLQKTIEIQNERKEHNPESAFEWVKQNFGYDTYDFLYEKQEYFSLATADSIDGHSFERWCAKLLERNGFTDVQVTQESNDQGIDVLARKDGLLYGFQCKRYASDLGNKPIQEATVGRAIYGCDTAVVMTNQHFTKGAVEAATATGVWLWDREKLENLIESIEEY